MINDEARYVGYRTNNKDDFLLTIALQDKRKYIDIFDARIVGDRIAIAGVLIGDVEEVEKPLKSAKKETGLAFNKELEDKELEILNSKINHLISKDWDDAFTNKDKSKIGKECLLAIQTCKDPNFIQYVDEMQYNVEERYKRTTKEWLLTACNIASRKELDTNEEALMCFRELQKCYAVWATQKGLC